MSSILVIPILLMFLGSNMVMASEGLYAPRDFPFPPSIEKLAVIGATVRIRSPFKLDIHTFAKKPEKPWDPTQTRKDENGHPIFFFAFAQADKKKCKDPTFYLHPGNFEFCLVVKERKKFPQTVHSIGNAGGAFISHDGYILTNHHVAMNCIEAMERRDGTSDQPILCKNLTVDVFDGFNENGTIHYRSIDKVYLVANSSKDETWLPKPEPDGPKMGLDVALLKVEFKPESYFEFENRSLEKFQRLYMLGHPVRSLRAKERLNTLGYKDADNSLRVSVGLYMGHNGPHTFLTDLDGMPGNSGSPTFNDRGKLVGLLSTGVGEKRDTLPLAYGGVNPQHVDIESICRRFKIKTKFPTIRGCQDQ